MLVPCFAAQDSIVGDDIAEHCHHEKSCLNVAPIASSAQSTRSLVITSGGATRIVCSWVEAGLDLIEDQHHVVRGAEVTDLREIAGWRDDDASFPLDRLDEEGDRVRRDRLLQRLGVAEGDDAEARREWPRAGVSVLKPTIPRVRPWKLSAQTMISEGRKLIAE
jgi:hypothetical protein